MLSLRQIEDVCLRHAQNRCRYLRNEDGIGNYTCTKLAPLLADEQKKELWQDNHGQLMPLRGDNCSGYLYLKHKLQGYDVI